jgi:EthD domain
MHHGPKVRASAHAARIRRYIPVHRLADDSLIEQLRTRRGGMDVPFTGHAEVWFDRQELMTALGSPEGMKAFETFAEDERTFIDHSRSAYWVAKEHVFIDR